MTEFYSMAKIHPAVLIVCFLVLVSVLAASAPSALLLSSLLIIFIYSCQGRAYFHSALVMLRRMRWFLFSIFIVYCWFTPGESLFSSTELAPWLPTYEGFLSGMQRVVALIIVIASVNLLLCSLTREQLLSAIHFLVRPLRVVGVKPETVTLRMVMVFDAVAETQQMMSQHLPEKGKLPRRLNEVGRLAAVIFHAVVMKARGVQLSEVTLPMSDSPPVSQWIYPLVLWAIFYLSRHWWS